MGAKIPVWGGGLPPKRHPEDPAWICARGPFPEAHNDKVSLSGSYSFERFGEVGGGPLKKEMLVKEMLVIVPWSWWMLKLEFPRRKPSKLTKAMQIAPGTKISPQKTLLLPTSPFLEGGHNNRSMSHLDRFLITADWECQFNNVVQNILPRPVSDHCPILLDSEGIRSGPSPFRFEIMWLKFEGFKDLLRNWWQGLHFVGSFSFVLASKLKGILKVWNKEVFGRVKTKKEALSKVSF